jgi:uncharacterized protein with PhoU and TrkA domain
MSLSPRGGSEKNMDKSQLIAMMASILLSSRNPIHLSDEKVILTAVEAAERIYDSAQEVGKRAHR